MVNDEYRSDVTDVRVRIERRTERAVLVSRFAFLKDEPVWFPLSQVEIAADDDGSHTLTAPDWLLKKEGWL